MVVFVFLLVAVAQPLYSQGATPQVTLGGVTFTGVEKTDSNAFYGIRFADADRFEDPQAVPVSSLDANYDATVPGAQCVQDCTSFVGIACLVTEPADDCLFLNIFAPKDNPSNKAVLFFIHGGNFQFGSGAGLLYDGDHIVKIGDVILVTINYRMGVTGFLGDRNLGIKDQVEAVKWVYNNIAGFGGDKTRITVMGQSAGAMSAGLLMSIPEASSKIKRVIIHSYPASTLYKTVAEGLAQETNFADAVNCPVGDVTCYRALSIDAINEAQANDTVRLYSDDARAGFLPWCPTIDGSLVQDHPFNLFERNLIVRKDMIIGHTKDESIGFVQQQDPAWDFQRLVDELQAFDSGFDFVTVTALALSYPNESDRRETFYEIASDFFWRCPNRLMAQIVSEKQRSGWFWNTVVTYKRVYRYDFVESFPAVFGGRCDQPGTACHGEDLPYFFGSFRLDPAFNDSVTADQRIISDIVIDHWTNFVKTGNPSTINAWSRFRSVWWNQFPTAVITTGGIFYSEANVRNEVVRCTVMNAFDAPYNP